MSNYNVKSILRNLKSDKIKERQEALIALRNAFADDQVVSRINQPKNWLVVFQALFHSVTLEKIVATKSTTGRSGLSTAASIRRLSEAASAVRWLIERVVRFMNTVVVKSIFSHLISMLPSDRTPEARLLAPVALDYAKALKCLVKYTPHLDHLDDETWVTVVEISFNVVLDDPIRSKFAEKENEQAILEVDSDMYEEDDEMADELDSDDLPQTVATNSRKRQRTPVTLPSTSKKRPRTERSPTPMESPRNTPVSSRTPVSLEQVEFASLLSIMIASPTAPILRFPNLASGILNRLERVLQRYPSDSSLLHDFLTILSSTLNHISLNKKYEVAKFARSAWAGLVDLWGTKERRMKTRIIMILRHLFRFTICPIEVEPVKLPHFDRAKEFGRLRDLLDGEAESRWGVVGLSLDALRLQLINSEDELIRSDDIFITKTFRAGWNFNADHALSWAVLEMQADCVGNLYQLSESMNSTIGAGSSRMGGKRKSSEPVSSLLDLVQSVTAPLVRSYHLQTLLFVVNRHWAMLHKTLKERVIDALLQYVTFDHATVQSWIFLNLAAIAQAEGSVTRLAHTSSLDPSRWDSIWTHAVRRANVPAICRAACHAAYAVLASHLYTSKTSTGTLASHRILLEIETLTKDMDIQGPAFPFDSVCIFLSRCLTIASQDARLHRMHLEDKVLSWLIDAWEIAGNKLKMPSNTVQDILLLLEAICGLSRRIELFAKPLLPQSEIVDSVMEENKVKIIQDYVLYAEVPLFAPKSDKPESTSSTAKQNVPNNGDKPDRPQFVPPTGRERKISAFLLNALDVLTSKWEAKKKSNGNPTAEMVRQSLDLTITALVFESLLALNGTASNKQVVKKSGDLLSILLDLLNDPRWSTTERLLLAQALEVLICDDQPLNTDDFRDALSLPGHASGIKEQTLQNLLRGQDCDKNPSKDLRQHFLRMIWQHVDLQKALDLSMSTLQTMLSQLLTGSSGNPHGFAMDIDDLDGFGAIRTAVQSTTHDAGADDDRSIQHVFRICVGILSYGPFLRSPSAEPTQDKGLVQSILDCAAIHPERLFLICPIHFKAIRQGVLFLPIKDLDQIFKMFGTLLLQYPYSRNEPFHRLVLDLLTSSLGIWSSSDPVAPEVQDKFCQLSSWLYKTFVVDERKKSRLGFRSWALRDAFAQFLDKYLLEDPTQSSWPGEDITEFPSSMLLTLNDDEDTRVRFRAAMITSPLSSHGGDAEAYGRIAESLPTDLDDFEHILTRILALGNMMIVNSAVCSGAYWNLLEACLHREAYATHIEAVLVGVSDRLGISPLSSLFETYASQLVYTVIIKNKEDFMHFPPRILGYHDRKQFAQATFRVLTPTYIFTDGTKAFERHCKLVQKTVSNGLQDGFGDIVGFLVAYTLDDSERPAFLWEEVDDVVKHRLALITDFSSACQENLDGIIIQILKSLGDQDCSENGPIASALQAFDNDGQTIRLFRASNSYRHFDTFPIHTPNRPAYPTKVVLESLAWLVSRFSNAFSISTTYHVIQGLMNDIHQTPLVNEQIRLINALTLWMAYRHQDIQDITILQIVVHGATLLLSQWDLARSAQSILEMAFRVYRKKAIKDTRLPNFLIRICSIAHDYVSNDQNRTISKLGLALEEWIDKQAHAMTKIPVLQGLVLRALPAWPRPPSPQLLPFFDQTTLQSLASVLEDQQITSNKFRLVRRFKDQAAEYSYDDDDEFANTYFWRLKDCMPSPEFLQDQDVESFADLVFLHHGQIRSFDVEQPNLKEARARHRRNFRNSGSNKTYAARDAITLALLVMLEDDTPLHVRNAYNTLRLVTAVSSPGGPELQMPSVYRTGLESLKAHRRSPLTRPIVDMPGLLISDAYIYSACNFPRWISLLTILLSDTLSAIDPFFGQLSSILESDTAFAEEILPILVFTLLHNDKEAENGPQSPQSSKKSLSVYFTTVLSAESPDISCIRSIVDVVLHLRYFLPSTKDQLIYNKWLDIDFTLLARSAILCGAYTTALLFVELAAERDNQNAQEDAIVEQVLYNIYAHIDEPDGFYGIKTQNLPQFLIRRFHHEQQWDKAFRFHGAALEAGTTMNGEKEGLVDSFHSFGFNRLAVDTLRKISDESSVSPSAMNFKLGWRTENWDLPDQAQDVGAPLYRSLRAIHRERDPITVENTIRSSLRQEMGRLRSLGSENLTEIRAVSRDLMCLSQVKEWRQNTVQELNPDKILDKWDKFVDMDTRFEFSDLEPIMATRISLVRSVRQREERRQIGALMTPIVRSLRDIEKRCLVRLSEAARASGQIQIALNSVVRAQGLDLQPTPDVSEEFANVLWVQKEERMAVQYLQNLVEGSADTNASPDLAQKALWLSRLGTWTSEAYLEKPVVIWEKYFAPAVDLLDNFQIFNPPSEVSQATVYRECAMFAERQYQATLKSPDAIRWKVYVDRKKQEIEHRRMELAKSQTDKDRLKSLSYDQSIALKLLNEDSALFKQHNTLREAFLKQAIEMHSRCLEVSGGFDNDSAIRFCSLWFANFDDQSILDIIRQGLERIPSRKLVFLAHQLTARVAQSSWTTLPPTQQNLQNLVLRMCREHPFHSLYQVYCLADHSSSDSNRRQSGRLSVQSTQNTQTERGTAASDILDRLRDDPATGERVCDVERLCDAYLEWAKYPIKNNSAFKGRPPFDVPPSIKLLKIQNLKVPISTARTPVDPTMKYENCAWLKGYERTFTTAGGVNLPKISICHDMEGTQYKQLFKGEGKDDMRQDAVMEQVFDLVNGVLKQDRETRRRQLRVRDYKVIPLASQAGMLEFVGNTAPIRDWLYHAHPKYRPQDYKPNDVTGRIKKYQEAYPNKPDKQLEAFLQVKERFKPIMRHYFTENHKNPISWFKMRLRYTRSVATTSIVGHVLGLGDRHTSNILIDNVTGDVIHIDLGIAFDQGKLLGVPERVPFRMTADIVDGMGISGTSGVFQRCAEETLRVLREESGVIMTVLEVFKHDPLHSWTASEVKVKQAQSDAPVATTNVHDTARFNLGIGIDMSSGTAEESADRALTSVARKLDKSLSVESTVNELVAEATDPMNLATIYHGWGPHL